MKLPRAVRAYRPLPCLMAAILAASCAAKSAPSETARSADVDTQTTLPEGLVYKDMTKEQRGLFMVQKVMPTMKPLFQEFDAKEFATFTCGTCHGGGAKNHSFAMPDPEIPSLPAPEDFMAYAEKHGPWVQFMAEKVTPTMAKLLDEEPFNPATNTGEFSCHHCHQVDPPKSAAK